MMFEVCRSLALHKTPEFVFTGFLACYWFGQPRPQGFSLKKWVGRLLIWEKAITKKRIYSNNYERNRNKDVIIIINTKTEKLKNRKLELQ